MNGYDVDSMVAPDYSCRRGIRMEDLLLFSSILWIPVLTALSIIGCVCSGCCGPTHTVESRVDRLEAQVEGLFDDVGNHLCNDDLHVTDSQMRPDPNGVTPLGTFTVTIIPRMADDSIWETFEADATRIDIDKEACASLGVRYPARFAKVWEADLGKIARYQRLPEPDVANYSTPVDIDFPPPGFSEKDVVILDGWACYYPENSHGKAERLPHGWRELIACPTQSKSTWPEPVDAEAEE